jgi:hypothetical protein
MHLTSTKHQRLSDGLEHVLQGLGEETIVACFRFTLWFAERYVSAYELPRPIYLVLDNSLIQAFKHRQANAKRALHALAFETFCGFVRDWSDREVIWPSRRWRSMSTSGARAGLGRRG